MYTESIPPEYFNHNSVLVESDIYHVGLTLYRACNGNPFYSSQIPASYDLPRQVVAGRFPDRSQFLPHVPKKLRTIIRRALEVEPADRFKTATDFSNELGKVHINHDWNVTFLPTGEVEWKANRPKKADLVVRLAPATSGWSTEIYGDRSGVRRKCSGVFWKSGLARKDADKHLKSIFEALG